MAESHVISALTKKRAEVLGEIKHYEKLLKQSKINLQSIDHTIHIFDPSYDLRVIRAKRVSSERYFKTGEAKVLLLDILRSSDAPISTTVISERLAADKELEDIEGFDFERFQKIILASLTRCQKAGLVKRTGKEGMAILWEVAPS